MKREYQSFTVEITELVNGGQGLGTLPDGKKVFVWNALPGEKVEASIYKMKSSYAEAVATKVIKASPERCEPRDPDYLATSPWQIINWEVENSYKKNITKKIFVDFKLDFPEPFMRFLLDDYYYRNKMEYSFWGNEDGLNLALHRRGSHNKIIVPGSSIAMKQVDSVANAVCNEIGNTKIRASALKTIIVRSSQNGTTAASLFVKDETFPKVNLPNELAGLRVYYSNPKSPASVRTKLLYETGQVTLEDKLLGNTLHYDTDSFFQVNLPVFELVLQSIKDNCLTDDVVDMYSGVGSIGLCVARQSARLIESDLASVAMAKRNCELANIKAEVFDAQASQELDKVTSKETIIVDPPRAGLQAKLIDRLNEVKPPQIIYLSCNPATQARDLTLLASNYKIEKFEIYNFFPRTPHIESLVFLSRI